MRWYKYWLDTGEIRLMTVVKTTAKTITVKEGFGERRERIRGGTQDCRSYFYTSDWRVAYDAVVAHADERVQMWLEKRRRAQMIIARWKMESERRRALRNL